VNFRVAPIPSSSILNLFLQREEIWLDPPYQRAADIWPIEKRQLLIDSLLNGFDIPKFYFHDFYPGRVVEDSDYRYAIIDGKQRLSAIWQFIEGAYPLDEDASLINSPEIKIGGLTYAELGEQYPRLRAEFDANNLSVIGIQTEDTELIEEMFSRLNEAVALSAAEKRNALRGPLPPSIRELASEALFTRRLPFGNSRYRHFEIACKFLLLTDVRAQGEARLPDLKKAYLDDFVIRFREEGRDERVTELLGEARDICARMTEIFVDGDPLLRQVGMVTLYFVLARDYASEIASGVVTRHRLAEFDDARKENRRVAEEDELKARFDWLEFDRLAQSPNDAVALSYRFGVLRSYLFEQIE
jgi:hypothetical protein